jgi:hypothetical protein
MYKINKLKPFLTNLRRKQINKKAWIGVYGIFRSIPPFDLDSHNKSKGNV